MPHLLSAAPIGAEDLARLPVRDLTAAIEYYEKILGFGVLSQESGIAIVGRDAVRLGLLAAPTHQPGKAGSVAIKVDDLAGLHAELSRRGAQPGEFGLDEWDGQNHQTFFVREAVNGYCYCFYS